MLDFPSSIKHDHVNLDFNIGLSGPRSPSPPPGRRPAITAYREAALAITRTSSALRAVGAGWSGSARPAAVWGRRDRPLSALGGAHIRRSRAAGPGASARASASSRLAKPEPRGGLQWVGFPLATLGMPAGPPCRTSSSARPESPTSWPGSLRNRRCPLPGSREGRGGAHRGDRHGAGRRGAAAPARAGPDRPLLPRLLRRAGRHGAALLRAPKITGSPSYAGRGPARFARGISGSGVPETADARALERRLPVLRHGGHRFLPQPLGGHRSSEYLDFARRVADQTLSQASDLDGKGLRWYQAWTRTQPWARDRRDRLHDRRGRRRQRLPPPRTWRSRGATRRSSSPTTPSRCRGCGAALTRA